MATPPAPPILNERVAAVLNIRVGQQRVKGAYVTFNRQAMDGLLLGWYRRAGVVPPPWLLAHALRHTHATLLVDAGASLPEVQRLLGHASLRTTQVHLKVAGRGLEEAALANPARAILKRRG